LTNKQFIVKVLKKEYYMSDRVYGPEEKAKLDRLVKEGVSVLQEIADLQGGLKDTIKSVAEELNVKPSLINKAIKVAMKRDWTRHTDEFEDLETIVATLGYDKDD
jgi:transposase-like protein